MTIGGFKDFIRNDIIYFVFPIVELSIEQTPRRSVQCMITRGEDNTLLACLETKESLEQLRDTINQNLKHEAIILIDSIQGRIFTSFKPESGPRFYPIAKTVSYREGQLYTVLKIDDGIPFIEFLKSILPDPLIGQSEITTGAPHEHVS